MFDILVLILDSQYEEEILTSFQGRNYILHRAYSTEDTVEICNQDLIDAILIWPATEDKIAEIMAQLEANDFGYLPVIPVVPRDGEHIDFSSYPIADIIQIPLPKKEFFILLEKVVKGGEGELNMFQGRYWRGSLTEFSLVDLIQMVEASRKDAIMTISYKDQLGQVFFREGKVIRATLRNLKPLSALTKLLNLHRANFNVQFTKVDISENIELSNQEILVELLQQLTEQEKFIQAIPDLEDELITLNQPPSNETNDIKSKILELCTEGKNVYDLLISLNEQNDKVLQNIQELIADGYLVRSQDYEEYSKQKEEKKGLSKIFTSLSGMLRKNKKSPYYFDFPEIYSDKDESEKPGIIIQQPSNNDETIEKIRKFIEAI